MNNLTLKICSKCGEEKPLSSFDRWNNYKGGYYPSCKACKYAVRKIYNANNPGKVSANRRRYYLRHRDSIIKRTIEYRKARPQMVRKIGLNFQYGITPEYFNQLETSQRGLCAICEQTPNHKRLFVDHSHSTNKVRGLLCRKCNSLLGFANDNTNILNRAVLYLNRSL